MLSKNYCSYVYIMIVKIQVSRNRMYTGQGSVSGLNSSRKLPINLCPKVSRYEDMGILY
jgi:hypothetical protein